jgi:hypothetical protein
MNKAEIGSLLQTNHRQFIELQLSLDEKKFTTSVNGKWSPCQELDHIIRAVQPVVLSFYLPAFFLKLIFGVANRPSKSHEALIEKYQLKLTNGGKASGRFVPRGISFNGKVEALKKLESLVKTLIQKTEAKSEEWLDHIILPHPLLGKLTMREMLYFTAYHVQHHRKNTIRNLESSLVS